jgi:G-rich domain on putative tyrosine kinase
MPQEEQNTQQPYLENDEITLKELLLKLSEYGQEVRKNWFIIALICLATTGFFMYKAFVNRPEYLAKLTFMVNTDDSKSAGGAAASILGQFGLGGGDSKDNLDKILALSKTNTILEKALFRKVTVDGVTDCYANELIRDLLIHEKWEKDTSGLKGFLFSTTDLAKPNRKESLTGYLYSDDNTNKLTRVESNALKALIDKLVGNEGEVPLFNSNYDKKTGIMSLTLNTYSEDLSIKLLEEIYLQLSKFYIDKTVEKQKRSYELVSAKADSIESALNGVEYRQADFEDHNRMILFEKAKLPKLRLNRDRTVLNLMYNEAVKNQELAEFSLKNKIPYVQAIDTPFPPIKPTKESKAKALIIGLVSGFFLGVIFIIMRKIYRDALT